MEGLITHLFGWLITLGATLTALSIWFDASTFPGLVFRALYHLGVKRNDPEFWPPESEMYPLWLRSEWEDWANSRLGTLAALLTCPTCMSPHLALWLGLAVWLGSFAVTPLHPLFLAVVVLTIPGVALRIYRKGPSNFNTRLSGTVHARCEKTPEGDPPEDRP